MASKSDFISNCREASKLVLDGVNLFQRAEAEFVALGRGTEGLPDYLEPGDFVGANADLTLAEIQSGFTTLAALETLLAQGHATNLHKLKP